MRPMFGSFGRAVGGCVAGAGECRHRSDPGAVAGYGLTKRTTAVRNCRTIGKKDMKLNDATPKIEVDPETYRVTADGEHLHLRAGRANFRSPSDIACFNGELSRTVLG